MSDKNKVGNINNISDEGDEYAIWKIHLLASYNDKIAILKVQLI